MLQIVSKSLLYCSTQVVAPTVPHSRKTRERGQRTAAGGMEGDAGRVPSAVCRTTGILLLHATGLHVTSS